MRPADKVPVFFGVALKGHDGREGIIQGFVEGLGGLKYKAVGFYEPS
jgi:hypothetical protein